MEEQKLYCVPVVVDGNCYTTQSVYAEDEEEAISLAVLHWTKAKYDPTRQITVVVKNESL